MKMSSRGGAESPENRALPVHYAPGEPKVKQGSQPNQNQEQPDEMNSFDRMKSISLTRPVKVDFSDSYTKQVAATPLKGMFRGNKGTVNQVPIMITPSPLRVHPRGPLSYSALGHKSTMNQSENIQV